VGTCLRRGLLAGLVAGVLVGVFHFLASEPVFERAVRLEVALHGLHGASLVSRGEQRIGLIFATVLYGSALGGVFGFFWPILAGRMRAGTAWTSALRLAFVGFLTLWLVPFLKYPSNPPGVGTPESIGFRTTAYLGMTLISIAATALVWTTSGRLSGAQPHVRQLVGGGAYILVIAFAYVVLPGGPDAGPVPAQVVWSFRMMSAAGQALLWVAMGAGFGLLTIRAEEKLRGSRLPVAAGASG
jgi:Probable cobalt transporter subunit (CbtA)